MLRMWNAGRLALTFGRLALTFGRLALTFGLLVMAVSTATAQDIGDLIREGKIQEARVLLTKLEKENKNSESVLFLRGLVAGRADSAETCYETYLARYPDGRFADEAQFRLAQLKYAQGLYRSSQKRFTRILEQHPLSPFKARCLYWSGMCYQAMNQGDSARILFKRLNEGFPDSEFKNLLPVGLSDAKPDTQLKAAYGQNHIEPEKTIGPAYSVQIGAFSSQNNALLRKAFFEREGYPVSLRTKRRDGDTFYLVWIGSFSAWEEAKTFGESIKAKYGSSYTLVSE
jgi:tetratricopeptide (TPR) repeat protein